MAQLNPVAGDATDAAGDLHDLLRESVRRLLAAPDAAAAAASDDPAAQAATWERLVAHGLNTLGPDTLGPDTLGSDPAAPDLPAILLVMQELGAAGCTAPLLPAVLANLALGAASPALGGAPLAFSFADHDGDRNAGTVRWADGVLRGRLRFVAHLDIARTLLVLTPDDRLCAVDVAAPGVVVTPTPGLGRPALADVSLDTSPVAHWPLEGAQAQALQRIARLCQAARALGAARRGLDLVLEHVRLRRQFGQPIGRFQAVQHKLATSHILLDGATLLLAAAGDAHATIQADGGARWALTARAAIAFCGQHLRQVALETQHCFGAIGFAEEHPAARLFRRIHADVASLGGVVAARADLAALLLDGPDDPFAAADAAGDTAAELRARLRRWLDDNWTEADRRRNRGVPFADRHWDTAFAATLGAAGWTALGWPASAGGQAASPLEQLAFSEELARVGAPDGAVVASSRLLAPALIAHGSPMQQGTLLAGIRAGTVSACLGYSEPEAGSDLASLRTRAVADGADFIINGQKLWTTDGHRATHMILAARTDPQAATPHQGISLFILPMDTPGITVQPMMAMYGHPFCSIFLDDVRLPASALLGPLHGGWAVLATALAAERIIMGAFATQLRDLLRRLVAAARRDGLAGDAVARDRLGGLAAEVEAARLLSARAIALSSETRPPLVESAMAKVFASELAQRLTETAIDLFGLAATLEDDAADVPADGLVDQLLRKSIMMVVGGGTNEIQRSVIAQRGLDLPR